VDKAEVSRATLVDVTVSLGVISFQVDMIAAQRSKKNAASETTKFKNVCPTCVSAVPLKQEYWCEHRHGPFGAKDADKAVAEGTVLTKVTPEAIETAKKPAVDTRTVDLHVFPAAPIETSTLPGGGQYRLRPKRNTKGAKYNAGELQQYELLVNLVANGELAFVAEVVVKGVSNLYRCVAQDGMLTLIGLIRPDDVVVRSFLDMPDPPEVPERLLVTGQRMVEEMTEQFDPTAWSDGAQLRLKELREAAAAEGDDVQAVTQPDTRKAALALVRQLKQNAA
jgi:non-homologous end joining protein Ku